MRHLQLPFAIRQRFLEMLGGLSGRILNYAELARACRDHTMTMSSESRSHGCHLRSTRGSVEP